MALDDEIFIMLVTANSSKKIQRHYEVTDHDSNKPKMITRLEDIANYCFKNHPEASYIFIGPNEDRELFYGVLGDYVFDSDDDME